MEWKDIGAAPGLEVTRGRLAGDVAIELGEPPPTMKPRSCKWIIARAAVAV
jgi:hypothetical protein